MKNTAEGLDSIFEPAEERMSTLEDRLVEIMQSEEEQDKKNKKNKCLKKCGTPTYMSWKDQK